MGIGATLWYNKGKGNKGKRKGKRSTTKAKAMAAAETTTATTTTKEEKANTINSRLDKEILSKEQDTETEKDTRTRRIWQGYSNKRNRQRIQGQQGYGKGKGHSNKGKGKGYYNNQPGGKGAKGKQATNGCYRCGQPGHMAKQCRVAIYNCDTGNFDTNDQTDDWHSQAHYDSNWYRQDQTQMQQVPISGLQEVAIAMIGTAQQLTQDNKWVSLMIDSGAATPVCPPWFATQSHYSASSVEQDHN